MPVFLPSPVGQITSAVFQKIFDLSVLGMLLSSQAAASRRREGGSIVNVSSVVANMGLPGNCGLCRFERRNRCDDSRARIRASPEKDSRQFGQSGPGGHAGHGGGWIYNG